jgi:hypothetical protein
MLYLSTYARNLGLHTSTIRDFLQRNCMKMGIYSGAIPASADVGVTGTLICTVTGEGETSKAAQKIRFTPTPGTANAAEWNIWLNGVKFTYIDDTTPSVAEVCTGLYNLIRAAIGTTSITTPAGKLNIPGVYGAFTLTDNTTSLDIEAAVAGDAFDYSASVSGAGAGTGSWATAVQTADAYGLKFEAVADIASGIIEKLATQGWEGVNAADGVVTHYRLFKDGDDQTVAQGASNWRIQGQVSTAGADLNFRSTQFFAGDTTTISDDFSLTWPASRT